MSKKIENKTIVRHTHSTAAGLEDALAVALDMIREYEESQNYIEARLRKIIDILKQVRAGPHNYDQDQPTGDRYELRRRLK